MMEEEKLCNKEDSKSLGNYWGFGVHGAFIWISQYSKSIWAWIFERVLKKKFLKKNNF